jgi:hypothetical protein
MSSKQKTNVLADEFVAQLKAIGKPKALFLAGIVSRIGITAIFS